RIRSRRRPSHACREDHRGASPSRRALADRCDRGREDSLGARYLFHPRLAEATRRSCAAVPRSAVHSGRCTVDVLDWYVLRSATVSLLLVLFGVLVGTV